MSKPDLKDLLSTTNEIDLTVRDRKSGQDISILARIKNLIRVYKIMYYLWGRIFHSSDFIDYRI
jgi:hypothetical protein